MGGMNYGGCAYGWNDQDYKTHLTNRCAGQVLRRVWMRVSRCNVVLVPLCRRHYYEWKEDKL